MHELIDHLLRTCFMPDNIPFKGTIRINEIFSITTGCLEKEETDIYTIILQFYLYTGIAWVILCFLHNKELLLLSLVMGEKRHKGKLNRTGSLTKFTRQRRGARGGHSRQNYIQVDIPAECLKCGYGSQKRGHEQRPAFASTKFLWKFHLEVCGYQYCYGCFTSKTLIGLGLHN